MSRNFPANTANYINLGDISAARFSRSATWSFLSFFRVETTSAERAIISKGDPSAGAGADRIEVVVDNGGEPIDMAVKVSGTEQIPALGNSVNHNTWYLFSLTCNGSTGVFLASLIDMAGTYLEDQEPSTNSNTGGNDSDPIQIGRRVNNSPSDPFDGDIAYMCYVTGVELAKTEISAYLRNPTKMMMTWKSKSGVSVPFFLPLGLGSPEPDLGGGANNGTINGTPTISDNPPIAPYLLPGPAIVSAAAVTRRIFITHT